MILRGAASKIAENCYHVVHQHVLFHHFSPTFHHVLPNPVSFPSSSPGQIHHDIFQLPKVIVDDDLPGLLSFVHEEVTIQALFSSGNHRQKKIQSRVPLRGHVGNPQRFFESWFFGVEPNQSPSKLYEAVLTYKRPVSICVVWRLRFDTFSV